MDFIRDGYVYHIKDEFFEKVDDPKLMRNKENGTYRPTFYCIKDEETNLLWMVPMSSRVEEKFQALHDKQVERYGECLTIVLGEFDQRRAAFLLQNMFPITEKYLHHVHERDGKPIRVESDIRNKVRSNMAKIKTLTRRGKKVVFPDINRIEKLMLEELEQEQKLQEMQEV